MITALDAQTREDALQKLPLWTYDAERKALYRQFKFTDFSKAIGFMMRVALIAERHDHHPEWSNVYNRVDVYLTTHDAAGVSMRDITMAAEMDKLAPNDA